MRDPIALPSERKYRSLIVPIKGNGSGNPKMIEQFFHKTGAVKQDVDDSARDSPSQFLARDDYAEEGPDEKKRVRKK